MSLSRTQQLRTVRQGTPAASGNLPTPAVTGSRLLVQFGSSSIRNTPVPVKEGWLLHHALHLACVLMVPAFALLSLCPVVPAAALCRACSR